MAGAIVRTLADAEAALRQELDADDRSAANKVRAAARSARLQERLASLALVYNGEED